MDLTLVVLSFEKKHDYNTLLCIALAYGIGVSPDTLLRQDP